MSRRKKKHHEEEHENHERWLVSYADFITLLFAFFVVMYAVSRVDNERLIQVSSAIRFALHFEGTGGVEKLPLFQGPPTGGSDGIGQESGSPMRPVDREKERAERTRRKLETRLRALLRDQHASAVTVEAEGERLIIRMSASRFFASAEAALQPEAIPILDAIAEEIVPLCIPIRVEGHTDERPIRSARFRNNWDLSAARAASVVSFLEQAHHVAPGRLSAAGFAAGRPLPGHTAWSDEEAARRVDIVMELSAGDPSEGSPCP
ncbi:OmpA/MotB family protein [Vulgatibacter incomptus]|uniref:Flagellar motor rotation protein MotB n=1 Tax=Vulgatibacter incomptus TaxID=1391653 RepID=A0A0K1PHK1_9BACT|nr:flagellar motor protein MotB [Vulgatibacter incomptus]AKU93018.1 Flagellar motor rotation protein MotB [Vulgatibacter incomptus]